MSAAPATDPMTAPTIVPALTDPSVSLPATADGVGMMNDSVASASVAVRVSKVGVKVNSCTVTDVSVAVFPRLVTTSTMVWVRVYVIGENVVVVVDNDVLAVGIVVVLELLLLVRLVKVKDGPALLDAKDVSVEKVVVLSSVDFCELKTDVDVVKLVEYALLLV